MLLFSCRPFFASAWRDLTHLRVGMDVPVALGVLIAFGASTAATFEPGGALGGEVWFDSVTMFVFFLLSGRLLEQRLRDRTAGALEALVRRLPEVVERVAADGSAERVPVRRLRSGERIRLHAGDVFPADGRIQLRATPRSTSPAHPASVGNPLRAAIPRVGESPAAPNLWVGHRIVLVEGKHISGKPPDAIARDRWALMETGAIPVRTTTKTRIA